MGGWVRMERAQCGDRLGGSRGHGLRGSSVTGPREPSEALEQGSDSV